MQYSPWGAVQHETKFARGLSKIYTASHGGIKVSKNLAEKYPLLMEVITKSGFSFYQNGYYYFEEDCDYVFPTIIFCDIIYEKKDSTYFREMYPTIEYFKKQLFASAWNYMPEIVEKYYTKEGVEK